MEEKKELEDLRAATRRLVLVNDEMGQALFLGGPEDDPEAWAELVQKANEALDECRKLLGMSIPDRSQ